jgi:hypothetical protein
LRFFREESGEGRETHEEKQERLREGGRKKRKPARRTRLRAPAIAPAALILFFPLPVAAWLIPREGERERERSRLLSFLPGGRGKGTGGGAATPPSRASLP